MTLRRYGPMKSSHGTTIPHEMRLRVIARDLGCVGFDLLPGECVGPLELDHVRASHGIGMKSETTEQNLVALCGNHHRYKTAFGREARPVLLAYLARVTA